MTPAIQWVDMSMQVPSRLDCQNTSVFWRHGIVSVLFYNTLRDMMLHGY